MGMSPDSSETPVNTNRPTPPRQEWSMDNATIDLRSRCHNKTFSPAMLDVEVGKAVHFLLPEDHPSLIQWSSVNPCRDHERPSSTLGKATSTTTSEARIDVNIDTFARQFVAFQDAPLDQLCKPGRLLTLVPTFPAGAASLTAGLSTHRQAFVTGTATATFGTPSGMTQALSTSCCLSSGVGAQASSNVAPIAGSWQSAGITSGISQIANGTASTTAAFQNSAASWKTPAFALAVLLVSISLI